VAATADQETDQHTQMEWQDAVTQDDSVLNREFRVGQF